MNTNDSRPCFAILVTTLCGVSALAQDRSKEVRPRDFLPRDHTTAARIDMKTIVDTGIWDAIERSPARMLLDAFRKEYGFDIAELDLVTCGQRVDPPEDESRPWSRRHVITWICEGSSKVGIDHLSDQLRELGVEQIGTAKYLDTGSGLEIAGLPGGVVVFGRGGRVGETLRHARKGGTPIPDLLTLTASPNAVALMAAVASDGMPLGAESLMPMPAEWFDTEDPPMGFRLQVVRRGQGDDFALEMMFRYASGKTGPDRYLAGLTALRAEAATEPWGKLVGKLLDDLERERSGTDLTLRLPLGDGDHAGARFAEMFSALVPMLFVSRSDVATVQVVEVEPVAAPPAPEPPPAKPADKGKR